MGSTQLSRPRRISGWWMALGVLLAFGSIPLAFAGFVATWPFDFELDLDLDSLILPFAAMRELPGEVRLRVSVPGEYGVWGLDPGPIDFDLRGPDGASITVEPAPPGYRCAAWDAIAAAPKLGEGLPFLVPLGRFVAPGEGTYLLQTGGAPPDQRIFCIRTRGKGDPVFDAYVARRRAERHADAVEERAAQHEPNRTRQNALYAAAAASFAAGTALWFLVLVHNGRLGRPRIYSRS